MTKRGLAFLILCAAGCYSPAIPNGVQQCGPKGECAEGYFCAADGRCYKKGTGPTADMRPPADMAVQCTPDACKDTPKPVCDPDSHACVDCLADGDCPLGKLCAQKACVAGCNDQHGCPSGMCVNGMCAVCKGDGDCAPPTGKCDVGSGKCVACLVTADCQSGEFCDPADHACHQGCDGDGQCTGPGTQKCCNHACYDVSGSQNHCGDCATDCGQDTCCAGFCSNLTSEIANCGGCGIACVGKNAMWSCMQSMCVVTACLGGFNDCDATSMNGCESVAATDVNNCGGCGKKCAAQNANVQCANGTCIIGSCMMGFADCNNQSGDGCEVSTAGDPMNCGGCGVKCNLANAAPACINGKCVIAQCNGGFSNCNGNDGDGCEAATATDPMNCGGCNNKCNAVPNATGVNCVNSMCGIVGCVNGFGNCDGLFANGCEKNLTNDAANCGMCGKTCPLTANAASTACAASACTITACNAGFANCDGQYPNGCEINTTNDKNNCSKCAMVCPNNGICVNSVCGGGGLCGNNQLDPGEERDPPPGPFQSVTVDAQTCKWHFENVAQLYCNGGCSWAGLTDCDQADADIFCKLRTNNPNAKATAFQVTTAQAVPGFSCPGYGVNLGTLPLRNVNVPVWYQDSSILANHGAGNVIVNPTCQ